MKELNFINYQIEDCEIVIYMMLRDVSALVSIRQSQEDHSKVTGDSYQEDKIGDKETVTLSHRQTGVPCDPLPPS